MVVKEAMRKHPPAFIMRKCTKNFTIPDTNLTIPEGTQININVFSFHRDPDYFPDPMKFDPERFSDENIGKIQQFTFFPFGDGISHYLKSETFQLLIKIVFFFKVHENASADVSACCNLKWQ